MSYRVFNVTLPKDNLLILGLLDAFPPWKKSWPFKIAFQLFSWFNDKIRAIEIDPSGATSKVHIKRLFSP